MSVHTTLQEDYFAVLDIGSNSVRFVVFSSISRTPDTVFNEKVLCGLGRDVGSTGAMHIEAMDKAIVALKRFSALVRQMEIPKIYAFATAAIRDASNGSAFVERVKKESGFDVDVIEGTEEARLAALGVISSNPQARGIVGDLGGGSLELARVADGKVHECVSLPIGPLRLLQQTEGDRSAFKAIVKESLKSVGWLNKWPDEELYIVGGAWRNLARLLLIEREEPIELLQGFAVEADEFRPFASALSKSKFKENPNRNLIPPRRRDILPFAAYLLKKVISYTGSKKVIVSSYGVREGVNYDRLSPDQQKIDPLLNRCLSVALERCRFPEHGNMLFNWVKPLFLSDKADGPYMERLHRATCLLADSAWRAHPDYKAERAVELALHGRWLDISHSDRAYMGVALNQLYGGKMDKAYIKDVLVLLSDEKQQQARALGAALRLGQRLSGGTTDALSISKIRLEKSKVVLVLDPAYRDLYGSIVKRRLKTLSWLLGRDYEVIYEEISDVKY